MTKIQQAKESHDNRFFRLNTKIFYKKLSLFFILLFFKVVKDICRYLCGYLCVDKMHKIKIFSLDLNFQVLQNQQKNHVLNTRNFRKVKLSDSNSRLTDSQ